MQKTKIMYILLMYSLLQRVLEIYYPQVCKLKLYCIQLGAVEVVGYSTIRVLAEFLSPWAHLSFVAKNLAFKIYYNFLAYNLVFYRNTVLHGT